MKEIGIRRIETERLILRSFENDDYELVYKNWTNDKKVNDRVSWKLHTDIEMTKSYIQNYKIPRYEDKYVYDFAICLKDNNEPIGEIEAVNVSIQNNTVEMGYCIGSKFWSKGYCTEALKAFIKYMFEEIEVDKVYAKHASSNPASGRVMQKSGMHYDATLKRYCKNKISGKREDYLYYSIDKSEYLAKK